MAGCLVGTAAAALLGLWFAGERGRLLRRSTASLLRQSAKGGSPADPTGSSNASSPPGVDLGRALHSYVYARWTDRYIAVLRRYLRHRGRPTGSDPPPSADTYHGKVLTTQHARAIVTLDHPIPLVDLEQVIPYRTARSLVLDAGPDIAVYDCPCRVSKPEHCEPTQVCMIVGQPFVDFILDHHPGKSHKLTQHEALVLLEEEHARGHVHTAWFKDAMLDRFFAICNCCACCCLGLEAMMRWNVPSVLPSGYAAVVDEERCTACGACVEACPFGALGLVEGTAVVDRETCMGCGVCGSRCTRDALGLELDPAKGVPLDVRALADGTAPTPT